MAKEYSTLINDINNLKKTGIIKFYKTINYILKYKERGKIVKNIRVWGMIQERKESIRLWTDYYKTLLNNDEKLTWQRFNNQIEHTINVEEGLERVAKRKAVGVDGVSGEWIRLNKDEDDNLKSIKTEKLRTVFKEVIQTSSIPDFWMKSKIVLISKENNNTPKIMNTSPIAILPYITKAFELSMLRNLEKIAKKQSYISHNQRGFTSKKSTIENIDDLFDFWMKAKERRKETKSSSALIFIDLKRAYDCVSRNKLLNLLDEARIPGDIIEIIKEMFNKSQITIDGVSTFKTTKGLLQGSCLSPILFNFYINPMLKNLEKLNAWCRAYADDIVIAVDNLQDINMYLKVVLEWCIVYEIELNPIKSGILRVLNRAGKIKGIKNIAKIPEVTEYKYLGLTINQSLNFKGLTFKIKSKSNYLRKQINKIKYTALSPKARKLILKTIYYQMITYGCTSVYPRNKNYRKWLNSAPYQLTKNIFGVRWSPSREILFRLLNLQNTEELINNSIFRDQQVITRSNNKHIDETLQIPQIINFILDWTMNDLKWKKQNWNCNLNRNQMHLINDCPDMNEWRKEWFEKLRVKSMDKIIDLITSKQWEKEKIMIADIVDIIRKFEEKLNN